MDSFVGKKIKMYWARWVAIFILVGTGLCACVGGIMLLIDPSGSSLGLGDPSQMTIPFPDYRLPGLLLLVLVGVLSLVAAGFSIAKAEAYPTIILLQGAILTGWTLIQVYLLPDTHLFQLVFVVLGIMLMLYGSFLRSRRLV
ncbi:MAG: hypothetical protein IM606_02510 [Cytophagales bacterium]|nr:hypothetical protein [Cytophagales bacterium]MCA6389526.1 hypothetical protein [Cytophagales bacterium]MCA6392057.1 hypothetical protein [Cytophagales bacterium]MCA6394037.1 hypothetical protein [Cytophagales bacterium]MCA6399781.1 hypothetical protein [Cytophagales bacterium]